MVVQGDGLLHTTANDTLPNGCTVCASSMFTDGVGGCIACHPRCDDGCFGPNTSHCIREENVNAVGVKWTVQQVAFLLAVLVCVGLATDLVYKHARKTYCPRGSDTEKMLFTFRGEHMHHTSKVHAQCDGKSPENYTAQIYMHSSARILPFPE